MLEVLDALQDALGELVVRRDARLCAAFSTIVAAPGELGDQHVAAVADDRRLDVLEVCGVRAHAGGVHAGLVRERVLADVRLRRVRRAVEQLVDEVRRLRQAGEAARAEHSHAHLQLQVGDDRDEVGVAGALADAVDRPLTWVAPASTAVSVLATPQPQSSWVWMPSARPAALRATTANAVRI